MILLTSVTKINIKNMYHFPGKTGSCGLMHSLKTVKIRSTDFFFFLMAVFFIPHISELTTLESYYLFIKMFRN